jgi:Prion-inhibition and propagation
MAADPFSISDLTIDELTFPAQLFSSGVVAFTSFGSVGWHFKKEESRYIVWGTYHRACSPGGLDPDHMPRLVYEEIVNTLIQINTLLGDKDGLSRYGLQEITRMEPTEVSIIRRESKRQQNLVKRLQKSSSLLHKARWRLEDQSKFAELVQQLTRLIDTLYETLTVPRGPSLDDAIAAQTIADEPEGARGFQRDAGLADLEQRKRAMNSAWIREESESFTARAQPTAPSPLLILDAQQLEFPNHASIPNAAPHLRSWARQRRSNPFSTQDFLVVEWRWYDPQRGREAVRAVLQRRIEALVAMLKEKPRSDSFRILDCIGYFEDNSDTRFGITFRLPNDYDPRRDPAPMSLSETMTKHSTNIPYLGERFRLAYILAQSVHAMLAIGWLHKGISPHNILFFRKHPGPSTGPISLETPYFTGFALSRRDDPAEDSSRTAAAREMAIYRHPDVAGLDGGPIARYRAIYDIYSLGIILLEIGAWRSISTFAPRSSISSLEFRTLLLDRVVPSLGAAMGERYMIAVRKCLEGSFERLEEFGQNDFNSADYWDNVRQGLLWEVVMILEECRA